MSKGLREKFETVLPPAEAEKHKWVSQKKARVSKGTPGGSNVFFNTTPPGMDVEDAEIADIRKQDLVFVGSEDVQKGLGAKQLKQGFRRVDMSPTDDHTNDGLFYEEVTVDGVTAYCERGNVLDRH